MDTNIKTPSISVIMSVYNGEKYLEEAIDSILTQSFTDFEFIIINDGSTDNSKEVISKYRDGRIKLINNKKNIGLAASLNRGIKAAKGKYIARMDADDISLPKRFKTQYDFMEQNPKIDICGTWYQKFGEENKIIKTPENDDEIKFALFNNSSLAHPTVFVRKRVFEQNNIHYNAKYRHIEDYNLWIDLIALAKFYNIKKVLLNYRLHNLNITLNETFKEKRKKEKIIKRYFYTFLSKKKTNENFLLISNAINNPWKINSNILQIDDYFNEIIEKNKSTKIFSEKFIFNKLKTNWQRILFKQKHQKIANLKLLNSIFYKNVPLKITLKFMVKCLINYKIK